MVDEATMKTIDKYMFNLNDQLGTGAFGKVYRGVDKTNNIHVAIKMIDKHMIQSDDYMLKGLASEIKVMKKLNSEFVVRLLDVIESTNNYYIIQQLCDGGDLNKILENEKKIGENRALEVLKHLLSGFIDLLKHGIIHRDLKPHNILIKDGIFKLADFGFARTVGNFNTELLNSLVGTPLYMSPQILKQEKYTTKCDIWSIALIYYQMIFGVTPWDATSQYHLVMNIMTKPVQFPSEISEHSKDFILKCLQHEEENRITWSDVYKHPLFEGYFSQHESIENKQEFILNNLRQKLIIMKDLDEKFIQLGLQHNSSLQSEQFKSLIKEIDNSLNQAELDTIFQFFDKNNDQILETNDFYEWLQQSNIKVTTAQSVSGKGKKIELPQGFQVKLQMTKEQQEKATETVKTLVYTIKKFTVDIKKLYHKFDKSKQEQMGVDNFGHMVKKIDQTLSPQQIEAAFLIFDEQETGVINFQQFSDTLSKYKDQVEQ